MRRVKRIGASSKQITPAKYEKTIKITNKKIIQTHFKTYANIFQTNIIFFLYYWPENSNTNNFIKTGIHSKVAENNFRSRTYFYQKTEKKYCNIRSIKITT